MNEVIPIDQRARQQRVVRIDTGIDDCDDWSALRTRSTIPRKVYRAARCLVDVTVPRLAAEVVDESPVGEQIHDPGRRLVQIGASSQFGSDDGGVDLEPCDISVALDLTDQLLESRSVGVGDTIEPVAETSGSADEKNAVVVSVYGLNDRQTMPRRDSGDATPRRTEDKFVPVSQDRCPDSSNRRHKPFLGPGDFPFLDRQRDDQERRQEPGDGTHIQRPHTVFWHTSSSKLTK